MTRVAEKMTPMRWRIVTPGLGVVGVILWLRIWADQSLTTDT